MTSALNRVRQAKQKTPNSDLEGDFLLAELLCYLPYIRSTTMVCGEEISVGECVDAVIEVVCESRVFARGDVVLMEGRDESAWVGACFVD